MKIRSQRESHRMIQTPAQELALFQIRTATELSEWTRRLQDRPGDLADIERLADEHFRCGAGNVVAAILAAVSLASTVVDAVEQVQDNADTSLRHPIKRNLMIRLLCGLVFEITTLYCAPTRSKHPGYSTEIRRGIYPELAVFGFAKKSSSALEERVSRAAALYPSFEIAQRELSQQGLNLDTKEIRRITLMCGESLLASRCDKVRQFLAGTLVSCHELRGKDVVVEGDGGRIRHRENKTQTSKRPGSHPKFNAEWREPKLLVIYTVDEHGKKEKASRVWLDGTLQGADHFAELLAATLYELGVSEAKSVTFIADGAPCLWDRFDWIVEVLHLERDRVHFILDFFHASQHLSLALAELYDDVRERREVYQPLRHELRQSRWEHVLGVLEELGGQLLCDPTKRESFDKELRYLRHHGESGHLSYVKFTRRGLPLGSGAVESAIRRVVNLRLKGNGMFWTPENAEKMLQIRCQLLSTEWDTRLQSLRHRRLRSRVLTWRWAAADHSLAARNRNPETTRQTTKCRDSSCQTKGNA